MSKSKDLSMAYGMQKRKKMAKGGEAKRDRPSTSEGQKGWVHDKDHTRGVHREQGGGESRAGEAIRKPNYGSMEKHKSSIEAAKRAHSTVLEEQRSMKKPSLPMAKGGKPSEYPSRSRETLNQMEQDHHNLRNTPPSGIRSKDDEQDHKRKELEAELVHHGRIKPKKMAQGGEVSAATEKRPMATKGMKTTPIKHPTMNQSPVFKTKLRDQEDELQEAADTNDGPEEQPSESDDEMGADRQGPDDEAMDMKMMAEGGEADGSDEMEEEHHDSIAAAIMARRDRMHDEIDSGAHDVDSAVMMAEGGQVDIEDNGQEEPNDFDEQNEAALKENYDSDMEDVTTPMDAGPKRHIQSDAHDMVEKIRKVISSKRQGK